GFSVTPLSISPTATFFDNTGTMIVSRSIQVSGVLLSSLQDVSNGATFNSSGKLFLAVNPGIGNVFGLFSQSQGTVASGQRMPDVGAVPAPSPTPAGSPTPTPAGTPTPTATASM